ncbi:hypothetical protein AGOR_G00171810 [Albula goreensis]|uniref:ADP-ribosyl cyclase/cyclic ADP-ribose hydrolase n=1 Tax=Albula goreensis TaxID=1534307 RepID=A0A8T3CYZ2_9TELE|nr:hypothetical protein AGOR_G00171810 [Albula goreensis]
MAVEYQQVPSGRRRRNLLVWGVSVLLVATLIAVSASVAVALWSSGPVSSDLLVGDFESTIIGRCKAYLAKNKEDSSKNDCEEVWKAFSGAYLGKDPCEVSVEAYDPLMRAVSERPACDRMLFWSKTRDFVHDFTAKTKCQLTLEDTLLGYMMNDQTYWCSEKGSSVTFTEKGKCPGWDECERNPMKSFWKRASAAFAESACGDVAVMLNGSIDTPFAPDSIFASVEVKKFHSPKMKALKVVLVTKGKDDKANCKNKSLQNLKDALDPRLSYECLEVPQSKIIDCTSHPDKACGNCW